MGTVLAIQVLKSGEINVTTRQAQSGDQQQRVQPKGGAQQEVGDEDDCPSQNDLSKTHPDDKAFS